MVRLLVGLGNPGVRYADTRHNVGWRVLDELARRGGGRFRKSLRMPLWSAEISLQGRSLFLAKPSTFMNASGEAVRALFRRKGFRSEDLAVVYDEVVLPCGKIRLRGRGSAAGHNGLQSVIDSLGTNEFTRLRIGVGPRPNGEELVGFVLSSFAPEDVPLVDAAVQKAADAVEFLLVEGLSAAMTKVN